MGNIMSSAVGSMAGVMGAHAIMGAFKGNDHQETPAPAQPAAAAGPCAIQYQGFLKCLENNGNNVGSCQWAMDLFNQCNTGSKASGDKW